MQGNSDYLEVICVIELGKLGQKGTIPIYIKENRTIENHRLK